MWEVGCLKAPITVWEVGCLKAPITVWEVGCLKAPITVWEVGCLKAPITVWEVGCLKVPVHCPPLERIDRIGLDVISLVRSTFFLVATDRIARLSQALQPPSAPSAPLSSSLILFFIAMEHFQDYHLYNVHYWDGQAKLFFGSTISVANIKKSASLWEKINSALWFFF